MTMEVQELQTLLEEARAELEKERVASADLSSALMATELQVADLQRQLREGREESGNGLRSQLAEQTDLAEQYRVEAADMRSMFDAMQHRIDTLQKKVADGGSAPAAADGEAVARLQSEVSEARAEVERLEEAAAGAQDLASELERAREDNQRFSREIDGLRGEIESSQRAVAAGDEVAGLLEEYRAAAAHAVGGPATPEDVRALGSMLHRAAELEAKAAEWNETEAELSSSLEEAQNALAATRKARDQWLERLEESGREKQALQQRVDELEAQLPQQAARSEDLEAARQECDRLAAEVSSVEESRRRAENELSELRVQLEDADSGRQSIASSLDEEKAKSLELASRVEELEAEKEREAQSAGELETSIEAVRQELAAARQELSSEREVSGELATRVEELEAEKEREAQSAGELETSIEAVRQELAAARQELSSEREVSGELATRVEELEAEKERGAQSAGELETSIEAVRQELAAARQELSSEREVSGELATRVEELEAAVAAAREDSERLEAQTSDAARAREAGDAELREQLADLEAQRSALAEEVESERAQRARLEDELAAAASAQVDSEHFEQAKSELSALRTTFDETVAAHAEELKRFKEESSVQASLARSRENEMQKLSGECAILQESFDEAIRELEGIRAERQSLSEQLRGIEDAAVAAVAGEANGAAHALNGELSLEQEEESTALADDGDGAELDEELESAVQELEAGVSAPVDAEVVVVHLEDDVERRAAVETALVKLDGVRYADGAEASAAGGSVKVLVNLASESFDLDDLADPSRYGMDDAEALAYCVKDGRGVFFRRVIFFPPPCDLDACASRLLAERNSLQRLLAVGEDVDFMSGLRERLGKVRCSTAIAFDGRQAVDLIPMVKPQVVLVDLNLPRGDGLRVASQVVANAELRDVEVAMFWSKPVDSLVFRQQAVFAMRDFVMKPTELARNVVQMFSDPRWVGTVSGQAGQGGSAGRAAANQPGN